MKTPKLIVITGHPGTGKTSIAKQLSESYQIPYISKDGLKERIFDGLGTQDKAWSLMVSGVAHRIMDDMLAQILGTGGSAIVESNFKPDVDSQRFTDIAGRFGATCLQILCQADGEVLFERWNDRISTGERHEGHVEAISLDDVRRDLAEPYQPLDLPGELIELDTTDFAKLELPVL